MSIISTNYVKYQVHYRNSWILFIFIIVTSALLTLAGQYLLLYDELYFNALSEQMTFEQIETLIDQNHQWSWLSYIILSVLNFLKFTFVASCLSLGYYFGNNSWTYKPFFRVAIQAELVLLLPSVIKLLWFLFIQTDYNLNDLQVFYPLSILSLIGADSVASYLLYPLQLANLFELAYWLVLAYGVSQIINFSIARAFGLVASSYGSGLLIWVVFIMFLTVSLS